MYVIQQYISIKNWLFNCSDSSSSPRVCWVQSSQLLILFIEINDSCTCTQFSGLTHESLHLNYDAHLTTQDPLFTFLELHFEIKGQIYRYLLNVNCWGALTEAPNVITGRLGVLRCGRTDGLMRQNSSSKTEPFSTKAKYIL